MNNKSDLLKKVKLLKHEITFNQKFITGFYGNPFKIPKYEQKAYGNSVECADYLLTKLENAIKADCEKDVDRFWWMVKAELYRGYYWFSENVVYPDDDTFHYQHSCELIELLEGDIREEIKRLYPGLNV